VKVSIIIPAYNAGATIAETLQSVAAQTTSDWELVLVNDGSTDTTAAIGGEFAAKDERIQIITRSNGGESAARNSGIAAARHDWLAFLDADDWIAPAYLEHFSAAVAADPSLDAIHCGWARVACDGTEVIEQYRPPTGDLFPTLARRAAFAIHACIVRKSLVDSVGRFDTSLRKSPDWDLWQRIARAGAKFGSVPEVLAYYRMTPHSASLDAEQMLRDGLTVLKRGHTWDPRVPNPSPEYANGWTGSTVESQEYYLLCWTAGLLIGSGLDARHLLEMVAADRYTGLYANAIAQCIFEAAILPGCQTPRAWEQLWTQVKDLVPPFLTELEGQSQTAGLAKTAFLELKKLVLKHSPTWGGVIEEEERERSIAAGKAQQLHLGMQVLEQEKLSLLSTLDETRRAVETLSLENGALALDKTAIERRLDELSGEKSAMETTHHQLCSRSEVLEKEKAAAETLLEESRGCIRELLQQSAHLASELSASQRRIATLEADNESLARKLAHAQERILESQQAGNLLEAELRESRQKNAYLVKEIEKWQLSASERAQILEDIQQETWMRLGFRLGVVKLRDVLPASSEMSLFPEGMTRARAGEEVPDTAPNWELLVANGCEAHLIHPRDDHQMVKVGITRAKTRTKWDIQLNLRGFQVTAGMRYAVVFRGRAERPRPISVGFAKAHEPWSSLGFYTTIRLTREWQTYREEFVPAESDDNTRIHFDLGGKSAGVDLTSVALVNSFAEEAVSTPNNPLSNAGAIP
jgi:Glycosyl transferase family 2/Carbohydrate binding domain